MTPDLRDIIDLEDLREMMVFFHEAAGLSVGIMDAADQWLVRVGWQPICQDYHLQNSEHRRLCQQHWQRMREHLLSREYLTGRSPSGLVDVAIPILLEKEPLGYFFLSQFLHQQPDRDAFVRQAIRYGYDIRAYLRDLDKVPVVSRQRIDYLMQFFIRFFDLLTRIGAENRSRRLAEQETRRAREHLEVRVEERTRELNRALTEISDLAAQLNESLQQVEHLAVTDLLTDTYNRRKFDEIVHREHHRAAKGDAPFSLIMFDIDHFKRVNDLHGHSVGDRVLRQLCRRVRGLVRQGDQLIRWGGEEFLILLPTTWLKEAATLAGRIRQEVGQEPFSSAGIVTISLGVAQLCPGDSIDDLMKRVDNALYQAKQQGRNRVVTADNV